MRTYLTVDKSVEKSSNLLYENLTIIFICKYIRKLSKGENSDCLQN